MKFEEYLKENKQQLDKLDVFDGTWNAVESQLKSAKNAESTLRYGRSFWILGVIALLLIAAFYLLNQKDDVNDIQLVQQTKKAELQDLKSLLQQEQISSRLKAINKVGFLEGEEQAIPTLLLTTVKNDPSFNVQLAALNAMEPYMENERVRIELIQLLDETSNGQLKWRIVSLLAEVNEKRVEPYLQTIVEDETIHRQVKREAGISLDKIKKL